MENRVIFVLDHNRKKDNNVKQKIIHFVIRSDSEAGVCHFSHPRHTHFILLWQEPS
jgi:hypothetical protein